MPETLDVPLEFYDNAPDTPPVDRRAVFGGNFPGYGRVVVRLSVSAFLKLADRSKVTVTF